MTARRLVLLLIASLCSPAWGADSVAGEAVFRQNCAMCHAMSPGRPAVGPSLFGVVGRASASLDYAYSDAMRAAKLQWTPAQLDRYLTDPQAVVPGTSMGFAGLADSARRANLIAYLATLSPAAQPK